MLKLIDWITDRIAIGNYLDAQDRTLLQAEGVRAVLSLDGTLEANRTADLGVQEIACHRLEDGPGNDLRTFLRAVDALARLASEFSRVLVQCHAGRSRSVVIVAAYLMRSQGLDSDSAVELIATKREVSISPALTQLLHRLEE